MPETAVSAAPPMLPRPFRVERVARETRDTVSLEMRAAGAGSFDYKPGQFNMLYALGAGEVPISISGEGSRPGSLVHTLRNVGAATAALVKMTPGDALGLRGPFGSAWPLEEARGQDVIVMAGGIGLAPLRPAIRRLLCDRDDYGRVSILYGARSPSELLYRRELEAWRKRLDVDVAVTVDRSEKGWRGPVGVVTTLLSGMRPDPKKTLAMVCGPEVMMRFCAAELEKRGLSRASIHLSMERNMKCAVGFCGHCQFGPAFICKDGPVFALERLDPWLDVRDL